MKKFKMNWKYAIGEILIVSIGIMIAFSINTCSDTRSKNKDHKEYISSLRADIEQNLNNINDVIAAQEAKVQDLKTVVSALEGDGYSKAKVSEILFKQRKSPTFFPISGTFKSLVAHGDIQLFKTETKRELFNLYDTNYERTVYNGNLYDEMYLDVYDTDIRDILNMRSQEIEDIKKLQSPRFTKNLSFIIDEAESYLKLVKKSKVESEKMLQLINKE